MRPVLVDTNVFSYFFKHDGRSALYAEEMGDRRLCVSFVTIAELRAWALWRSWGAKRIEALDQALKAYVVLGYDNLTAWRWAEVATHQRRAGRNKQDHSDWWIAACALRHRVPLITHNPSHFADIPDLEIITRAP